MGSSQARPSPGGPHDRRDAIAAARGVVAHATDAWAGIVRAARRQGVIDLGAVELCAARLVGQAAHGDEALHWCLRLEGAGSYLGRRALGTAAVAVTLGRRLGLERPALLALAAGGLLLDIGKVAVPVQILAKPGALDGREQGYVRRHVERALALVAGRDLAPRALEMLAGHHERCDGRGYPLGLRHTEIPLFARIAAIADAYDAMTLDRRYAAALSPHAALRDLERLRGEKYDAALVDELVVALGRFPVGTLVELGDGSCGLVCGQRLGEPANPQVIVTHDATRRPLAVPHLATVPATLGLRRALSPGTLAVALPLLGHALRAYHEPAA
jgi:HD-GYP domain-containing protein (c-di-GMP phosphodiesterase class II)